MRIDWKIHSTQTDRFEPKVYTSIQALSESLNPETELNPQSESLNPQIESLNPQNESLNPQSESLNPCKRILESLN